MPDLNVRFTGVNAYVFNDPMTVIFPNATCVGASPARGDLSPHLPAIWSFKDTGELIYLRYFPWKRLEIRATSGGAPVLLQATSPVQNAAATLPIPTQFASDTPDARKVSGQVRIWSGDIDAPVGGCANKLSWNQGQLDPAGLLHQMGLRILAGSQIELRLVDLFDPAKTETLETPDLNYQVFIGNVCAQDLLAWPSNNAGKLDVDFEWLDVLADLGAGLPRPVIKEGVCAFSGSDPIDANLATAVTNYLSGQVGGGGCGCECVGCQVTLV